MGPTVICTYRPRAGNEADFEALLGRHWQTLHQLELTSDAPPQFFAGTDKSGGKFFVEIFTWRTADAPNLAHQAPEVLSLWEPMAQLCEERDGRPAMEFPHVTPIQPAAA